MAITTVDGALAGMKAPEFFCKALTGTLVAGRPFSTIYLAGVPGASVAPAPGIAGAALTTYPGQIPVPPASLNTHLARLSAVSSAQGGVMLLCDRLWHNSGIVVTTITAQTVNSVAYPARDDNASINGEGVYIGMEISSATGSGNATPVISYTNQAGVAGRTSTTVDVYQNSTGVGSFYRLGLQAGDTGVRSIQTVTLGVSMTSGTIHLVAYRILSCLELPAGSIAGSVDVLSGGMPRMYDNSVPFLVYLPQATTTTQLTATMVTTQG